jgi:hypothetical protein
VGIDQVTEGAKLGIGSVHPPGNLLHIHSSFLSPTSNLFLHLCEAKICHSIDGVNPSEEGNLAKNVFTCVSGEKLIT